MEIKNKTLVITGASTGIGKAIAQEFISKWAKVIVLGMHKPDYKVDFIATDVSKEESIQKALSSLESIDIVVNNAGIGIASPLAETSTETLNAIMDTNFKGLFWTCKYALPKIKEGWCIISISSIAGLKSFQGLGIYCAAKAANISYIKTLALELAPRKIRVNTIAPGAIETPIRGKIYGEDAAKKMLQDPGAFGPLKRAGKPSEIAHAAIFLAENEFTTGSVVVVDGGDIV